MTITALATVAMVREKFPQAIVEVVDFRGEQTLVLTPESLVGVCRFLKTCNLPFFRVLQPSIGLSVYRALMLSITCFLCRTAASYASKCGLAKGEKNIQWYQRSVKSGQGRTGTNAKFLISSVFTLVAIPTCAAS